MRRGNRSAPSRAKSGKLPDELAILAELSRNAASLPLSSDAVLAEASRKPTVLPAEVHNIVADLDPGDREITQRLSARDILVIAKAARKKMRRSKGRPSLIPNRPEILDAAALAKVKFGRYTQIAAHWKLTPRQLIDLVHNNRKSFTARVKALRKA